MNCKKIQELILTDFLDDEANARLHKQVKQHLKSCYKCREFEQQVRKTCSQPFAETKEIQPPENVWFNIKERVAESEPLGFMAELKNYLDNAIFSPKPAIAIVSLAMILLVTFTLARIPIVRRQQVTAYIEEQVNFLVELEPSNDENGYIDLGTSIEEFLL